MEATQINPNNSKAEDYLSAESLESFENAGRNQREEMLRKQQKTNELIHSVFSTPQGKKLLGIWTESVLNRPTVTPEDTQFAAGIREGEATVIRDIRRSIVAVENSNG